MIAIVNYGLGNLASIKNMLKRIGTRDVIITSSPEQIAEADKIILPGVGAFDAGMQALLNLKLIDVLNKKALEEKVPFLGICLGMQLMTKGSEEGNLPGLGWFDAFTYKFSFEDDSELKIPHMGWNYIQEPGNDFLKPEKNYRFYFVHSYYVSSKQPQDILFSCQHGKKFHAGLRKENIIGMQFHPEKSLHFGMDVFEKFVSL